MISFLRPEMLLCLPVALAMGLLIARQLAASASTSLSQYAEREAVAPYSRMPSRHAMRVRAALLTLIVALVIVAMAQPVRLSVASVSTGSLRVVTVFDASLSTAVEAYKNDLPADLHGSALEMAAAHMSSLIMPVLTGNRLGIVKYSSNAIAQAEITTDFTALRWILEAPGWLKVERPPGGSDIALGLMEAIRMFDRDERWNNLEPGQRLIVLYSDGGYSGDAQLLSAVLEHMRQHGIALVVFGVGPDAPAHIPIYVNSLFTGFYVEDGVTQTTRIDEGLLRQIAGEAQGQYIRLMPGSNPLRGELEIDWPSLVAEESLELRKEPLYQYPLAVALALFVMVASNLDVFLKPGGDRNDSRAVG